MTSDIAVQSARIMQNSISIQQQRSISVLTYCLSFHTKKLLFTLIIARY